LRDKVVLVTGASSGLGRAIALAAAREGARLALCGRSAEKLRETTDALGGAESGRVFRESFDVTDFPRIGAFVSAAVGRFGGVDVLVNCAGANSARSPLEAMELGDLDAMMRLNCHAPAEFMRACHGPMAAAGKGLVVNVLSTCCLFANEGLAAYTASKSALDGLAKVYRKEARKAGIRVCSVYPGGINTSFRPQERPEYLAPEAAADAIIAIMKMDASLAPDEFVLRPFVETNYA
jgi:NAD(P)-dependent dehydrogenase (short-subunit alcohol dehydrogenase family)